MPDRSAGCQSAKACIVVPIWRRKSLVSWWEMEEFSAHDFYRIGRKLETLKSLSRPANEGAAFSEDDKLYFDTMFMGIHYHCRTIGLMMACRHIERLRARVMSTFVSQQEIVNGIDELDQRIRDEMGVRLFFYVPPEREKFYLRKQEDSDKQQSLTNPEWPSILDQRKLLFGEGVEAAFPSAIPDFEEAGKCLALGRGTACVFHLMRVMERGLKALAGGLNIPYAPSWESYLKQIEARITEKHATKKKSWKREEHFYRDAGGDLQIVKIAWRNPTMHVVRTYTLEEAEDIFRAVRAFMKRLAPKLPEKRRRKSGIIGQ
jgi:hypothetical protein